MRPADKELTAWCGHYMTLAPGVGRAFLVPVAKRAGAIAGAAAHTQGPVLRSRHDPAKVELSLDHVG